MTSVELTGGPAYQQPLTSAEKQKIIELYEKAAAHGSPPTCEAIAREISRSRTSVGRVLDAAGLEWRRKSPPVTAEETARIIELYQRRNGTHWTSTTDISRVVGRSTTTVHKVLTNAGLIRSVSEARQVYMPQELRRRIIRVYLTTGWSYPAVAEHLGVACRAVYRVLCEADVIVRRGPNSRARVGLAEADRIVDLYKSGLSMQAVADHTGRTRDVVSTVLHNAGVVRTRVENDRLAAQRRRTRARLATLDLRRLARRWRNGAALETLAAEHFIPADLLWEALSNTVPWIAPGIDTSAPPECGTCLYACFAICARTAEPVTSTPAGNGTGSSRSLTACERPSRPRAKPEGGGPARVNGVGANDTGRSSPIPSVLQRVVPGEACEPADDEALRRTTRLIDQNETSQNAPRSHTGDGDAPRLRPRQVDILNLMSQGRSDPEIARVLYVAVDTVRSANKQLYKTLGARNRAHAVAIAMRKNVPISSSFARHSVTTHPRSSNQHPVADAISEAVAIVASILFDDVERGSSHGQPVEQRADDSEHCEQRARIGEGRPTRCARERLSQGCANDQPGRVVVVER